MNLILHDKKNIQFESLSKENEKSVLLAGQHYADWYGGVVGQTPKERVDYVAGFVHGCRAFSISKEYQRMAASILQQPDVKIYFFGCLETPGHYLWDQNLRQVPYDTSPWGRGIDQNGQRFLTLHFKDGWSRLHIIDNSIDTRGGSNASFLINQQVDDMNTLSNVFKLALPEVWQRVVND